MLKQIDDITIAFWEEGLQVMLSYPLWVWTKEGTEREMFVP